MFTIEKDTLRNTETANYCFSEIQAHTFVSFTRSDLLEIASIGAPQICFKPCFVFDMRHYYVNCCCCCPRPVYRSGSDTLLTAQAHISID